MKKRIIALISLVVLLLVWACMAVGCTPNLLPKAEKLRYVEYTATNGKIYAKGVKGADYWMGYIVIGGKKISATFDRMFPQNSTIQVKILEKDAPEGVDVRDGFAYDEFSIKDLNEQNQLVSHEENDVLFGENFGQIVLVMNQLTKEDFEVWELPWQAQMIDDWELFSLSSVGLRGQGTNGKPVAMTVWRDMYSYRASEMESFFFVWLPEEKGFEIYTKEEDQYEPTEDQQAMATGTYVLQDDVVTLAFVTDGLFYGAYPTVELTLNVN